MLETRQATGTEDPFFSYLMFDGSHQPYSFPEEEALYEPYTLAIDYVELSDAKKNTEKRTVRWNSYSNALLRVDKELQRVWDMLEMTGEMKDTIILVTGDHGEEFFDHGFYGHLSNFAPAQSLVPLIIRGPGVEPGFEERPTSHVDVATTLLELLGADGAQREGWSLGRSLFDPAETRTRVMSGWETLGLWTESGVFYLPINAALGGPELYDYEWNLVLDDEPMFKREAAHIARLMRECRRFLK
jgi:membrane-anchored protein YejM (alkaline phosphatase superfamily)